MAAALLALAFLLPNAHMAHASDMEMEVMDTMQRDCSDDFCDTTSARQDCLEHCLQMVASDDRVVATLVPLVLSVIGGTAPDMIVSPEDQCIPVQTTGPPNRRARHLSTQKRE